MPTRADFERMNVLIAEAIALCEAAQLHFEDLNKEMLKAIEEGRRLTGGVLAAEEQARNDLYQARHKLSERRRHLRQLKEAPTKDE